MSRRYRITVLALVGVAVAAVLAAKYHNQGTLAAGGKIHFDGQLPVMIEFGAGKCTACKMMEPVLEELRSTYDGQIRVEYVDTRKNPKPSQKYRIRVIPAQVFCDANGKELFRHEGFFGVEDIVAKWRALGAPLQEPSDGKE